MQTGDPAWAVYSGKSFAHFLSQCSAEVNTIRTILPLSLDIEKLKNIPSAWGVFCP